MHGAHHTARHLTSQWAAQGALGSHQTAGNATEAGSLQNGRPSGPKLKTWGSDLQPPSPPNSHSTFNGNCPHAQLCNQVVCIAHGEGVGRGDAPRGRGVQYAKAKAQSFDSLPLIVDLSSNQVYPSFECAQVCPGCSKHQPLANPRCHPHAPKASERETPGSRLDAGCILLAKGSHMKPWPLTNLQDGQRKSHFGKIKRGVDCRTNCQQAAKHMHCMVWLHSNS